VGDDKSSSHESDIGLKETEGGDNSENNGDDGASKEVFSGEKR